MSTEIKKTVDLNAPLDRVWRALTDHEQFGEWFCVRLDGPFVPGETATGRLTYPGYEGMLWEGEIVAMDEPHYFSYRWHPYAVDPDVDYSKEEPTLVEFRLEAIASGTRLTVTESGFDKIPG
ncbi:MAG: SRPBCC family protein, partial [Pseudomonadota bacterium]